MKKFVPVLLGLTLAASLTACATKTVKEAPSAAPQTTAAAMEETTEAPAETSGAETEAAAKTEDTVTAAATDYFKNFPEDKHMAISLQKSTPVKTWLSSISESLMTTLRDI